MDKASIRTKLLSLLPVILLAIITIILCIANYAPHTFLSGWDTIHWEFNFKIAFQRLLSVFKKEEGLGAIAAHSDMADLPHLIIIYIAGFFISTSFIRYFYIFINLIGGTIGAYYFINVAVGKNKVVSFLGALFYLLNLGTMQQFVVPLEMFTTQYALMPWIFLFAFRYMLQATSKKQTNKKTLIFFCIATLLAAPMAYAATLWYIYFTCLVLFILALSFSTAIRKNYVLLKKAGILIFLTLIINLFWLLPNIYYIFTKGASVQNAVINRLFSPQAFLYNKEFSHIGDIALLKTYLFDWSVYKGNGQFGNLLQPWINHLNQPLVLEIGILFSLIALLGVAYSIYKKNKIGIAFIPVTIFSLLFLINTNPPSGFIFNLFNKYVPLFQEAVRFPDDKVLGIFILNFTLYFAFGQKALLELWRKIKTSKYQSFILSLLQAGLFTVLLIYFMIPGFQGQFISPYMRIQIPSAYFKMFTWFNSQKDMGRIAELPINSFWGWEYYNWYPNKPSFQGSGFITYGIKQPLLDQDFSRWDSTNEQYYREMSYAVYTQNTKLFKQVINKYNIHYILVDKSIIAAGSNSTPLFYTQIEKLVKQSGMVSQKLSFSNYLTVYKLKNNLAYTYTLTNVASAGPSITTAYQDFAYQDYGNYITNTTGTNNITYPFFNIIDNESHLNPKLISTQSKGLQINFSNNGNLRLRQLTKVENYIPADLTVEKTDNKLMVTLYPHLPFNDLYNSSLSITANLPYQQGPAILSVNQKNNFVLSQIPINTPIDLGQVILNTKIQNNINLYPIPITQTAINFSKINYDLSPCTSTPRTHNFGITVNQRGNGFSLFASHVASCMTIPLSNLLSISNFNTSQQLFNINFSYHGNYYSNVCLSDINTGSCEDYILTNLQNTSIQETSYYFSVLKKDFYSLGIKISLDGTQSENPEKATYTNFTTSLTKPASSAYIQPYMLNQSTANIHTTSAKTLYLPFISNPEINYNIINLPRTNGNCNQIPFGSKENGIKKEIIMSKNGRSYIEYSSTQGPECDHFSYQDLSQNRAYLIGITSRNITGLPLTACILNEISRRCDIYANLSSSKKFTQDFFLLPPMSNNNNDKGFDIDINNLGIKGSQAINDLASIEITPFPYNFVSQIKQTANIKSQKYLDVLSYSFQSGWTAYAIPSYSSPILRLLITAVPFLLGKKISDHIILNSWANGWIVSKPSDFIVIYYPEYLEILGLIILIGLFIYLIFKL